MDYHFISLDRFYRNPLVRLLRACLAGLLVVLILFSLLEQVIPTFFIALLNILVMSEIFYRYKLCRIQSQRTITDVTSQEALQVMTFPALAAIYHSPQAHQVSQTLLQYPQVRFFLERCNITPSELPESELNNAILPAFAFKLAKEVGGKRITTMDLLAAYLLLEEEQSHLLFTKKLKSEDIIQILAWTRLQYPYEEEKRQFHVGGNGGGIGEALVSGWTLETKKYTRNFTNSLTLDDVSIVGREKEYQRLVETLAKSENNNVVLVGEAGVGKEELVQKLALDSYAGKTPSELRYKTILELLAGSLLAGATTQGELQERVGAIIEEVSHASNVVLYIPEFQNMIGGSSFGLDLSGALMPYLQNGKLPVIASITEGNYKTYLERSSLHQLFSEITLAETTPEIAERMVMEKSSEIEQKQPVVITYQALAAAVRLADRYSQSLVLPGSAITLLSDVISGTFHQEANYYGKTKKRLITQEAVTKTVEDKTKIALSEPSSQERDLLLHLEDVLHQHVIGQDVAVHSISEALRRLRAGVETRERPISFLFLGPTGVGKTETAKTLASTYFSQTATMIRLDMSEYADEEGQRRLLGALPGQGEERGELTEQVRDHPYSLLLLDEFEKAHPTILNLFLQILEDGRLTDNRGRTVSFINTMIIATSNAGSDFIHEAIERGRVIDKQFESELFEYLQNQHLFKPELLNRFDGVITFKPLSEGEVEKITELLLSGLKQQLSEKDITVEFEPPVLQKVSHEAYNKELGARPIRRYIQDTLEDLLSQKLLANELVRGDHVNVVVDAANQFAIQNV